MAFPSSMAVRPSLYASSHDAIAGSSWDDAKDTKDASDASDATGDAGVLVSKEDEGK